MRLLYSLALVAVLFGMPALAASDLYQFEAPELVTAGGKIIEVESPGYAAPCLADVDGDGIRDLLVGQFKGGKIGFYKGLKPDKSGKLTFAEHKWLQAGGKDAEVPGVW